MVAPFFNLDLLSLTISILKSRIEIDLNIEPARTLSRIYLARSNSEPNLFSPLEL